MFRARECVDAHLEQNLTPRVRAEAKPTHNTKTLNAPMLFCVFEPRIKQAGTGKAFLLFWTSSLPLRNACFKFSLFDPLGFH